MSTYLLFLAHLPTLWYMHTHTHIHTHTHTYIYVCVYKHIPLLVSLENVNEYSTPFLKFICWWTFWLFKVWGHYKKKLLTFVNTFLWRLFISPGQIHKSKVVGLCKCMLDFIRNCQCFPLCLRYLQSMTVPGAPRPPQNFVSLTFLATLMLVQCHFTSFNLHFPNMQILAMLNIFLYVCWLTCDPHFAFGAVSIQTCLSKKI